MHAVRTRRGSEATELVHHGEVTATYREDDALRCARCTTRLLGAKYGDEGELLCSYCVARQQVVRDERAARRSSITTTHVFVAVMVVIALFVGWITCVKWNQYMREQAPSCGQEICS